MPLKAPAGMPPAGMPPGCGFYLQHSRMLARQKVGSARPSSYVSNPLGLPRKSAKIFRSFVTGFRARSSASPTPGKLASFRKNVAAGSQRFGFAGFRRPARRWQGQRRRRSVRRRAQSDELFDAGYRPGDPRGRTRRGVRSVNRNAIPIQSRHPLEN